MELRLFEDAIPWESLCSVMFLVCLQVLFKPQGGFRNIISVLRGVTVCGIVIISVTVKLNCILASDKMKKILMFYDECDFITVLLMANYNCSDCSIGSSWHKKAAAAYWRRRKFMKRAYRDWKLLKNGTLLCPLKKRL